MGNKDNLNKIKKENLYNYKIVFSYDGKNFFGYAKQPSKRSIEEEVTSKLELILNIKSLKIYASGRTDKGVHALNQVANFFLPFKLEDKYDLETFKYKLNKVISDEIYIKLIKKVPLSFNSRLSVKKKIYSYLINYKEYDPLKRDYELNVHNLDLNKIKEVKDLFIGKHSFINFTSKEEDEELDFIRTIYDIKIVKVDNKRIKLVFIGDGFMRYEIRKIVGTILAYNDNKITLNEIKNKLIDVNTRDIAPYQVSGKGLYLDKVIY